jgi:hypothetical protein
MSATIDFYTAQAAKCGAEAAATDLTNVRERCLRSQAAWLAMADRIRRADVMRSDLAAVKALKELDPDPVADPEKNRTRVGFVAGRA